MNESFGKAQSGADQGTGDGIPDISIVIPAYNLQDHIAACLESVLDQTGFRREIILVDDGSSDQTGAIVQDYARRHDGIVYLYQQNGGSSVARNTGLANAQGRYVFFVDADDLLRPGVLLPMLREADEGSYDMVTANHSIRDYDGSIAPSRFVKQQPLSYRHDIFTLYSEREFGHVVWNKLVRRDLAASVRFKPGLIHEDELYLLELFLKVRSVRMLPLDSYLHQERPGSSTSRITPRRLDNYCTILSAMMDIYESGNWPLARRLAFHNLCRKMVKEGFYKLQRAEREIGPQSDAAARMEELAARYATFRPFRLWGSPRLGRRLHKLLVKAARRQLQLPFLTATPAAHYERESA